MLIKQSWKKLSQATTAAVGFAVLVAFEVTPASAANLKTFEFFGRFDAYEYPNYSDPDSPVVNSFDNLSNGSFDGTYTVDLDQLPATGRLDFEDWKVNIRYPSGEIRTTLSSPSSPPAFEDFGYIDSRSVNFGVAVPSATYNLLELYANSNSTGAITGRVGYASRGGRTIPVYGLYDEFSNGRVYVTSLNGIDAVPEPFTVAGTAIAGIMGWWMRRQQKASKAV